MQRHPILSVQKAALITGMSDPTAAAALSRLEALGLVDEITGRKRDRLYSYAPYVAILTEGTEPIRTG